MKIIFICGCLEPGKDGVGDYTRRLAGELIRQGHQCLILALMDSFVEFPIISAQESEFSIIQILRLPYINGYENNSKYAKKWIEDFNPDFISLQYVPFSFDKKGLPIYLSKSIKSLANGRNIHIMFHEMWVGMNIESIIKLKLWGNIQRALIKILLYKLAPIVIHTHTSLYQNKILELGFKVSLLEQFGNIMVIKGTPAKLHYKIKNLKPKLVFAIFGSIHEGAPIDDFIYQLKIYSYIKNIEIEFLFVGRCGNFIKNWIDKLKYADISVKILGEQSIYQISKILNSTDVGITTTPMLLTQKSGTVAAMLEHGLPVVCVAKSWQVKSFSAENIPKSVILFKRDETIDFLSLKINIASSFCASKISTDLVNSLLKYI